jgi:hypothetical protein
VKFKKNYQRKENVLLEVRRIITKTFFIVYFTFSGSYKSHADIKPDFDVFGFDG